MPAIHSSMRIYPSERRLRRYVEQDDEQGFPRGGSRAKGRQHVTVQRASATRSRVHARVVKRVLLPSPSAVIMQGGLTNHALLTVGTVISSN